MSRTKIRPNPSSCTAKSLHARAAPPKRRLPEIVSERKIAARSTAERGDLSRGSTATWTATSRFPGRASNQSRGTVEIAGMEKGCSKGLWQKNVYVQNSPCRSHLSRNVPKSHVKCFDPSVGDERS